MITLNAPKISKQEREQLTKHKDLLEARIKKFESHNDAVSDLRKKEAELQEKRDHHARGANAFILEDESAHSAALKSIERCHRSIEQAESAAYYEKEPLFRAIDTAQELVQKICQATMAELIDKIADAISPFYDNRASAEWHARTFPATLALTNQLLQHRCNMYDGSDRIHDEASAVLRKVNALLAGDIIWTYSGVNGVGL
jgi:DNA repair exonuclease SbcCD ATPase subunit